MASPNRDIPRYAFPRSLHAEPDSLARITGVKRVSASAKRPVCVARMPSACSTSMSFGRSRRPSRYALSASPRAPRSCSEKPRSRRSPTSAISVNIDASLPVPSSDDIERLGLQPIAQLLQSYDRASGNKNSIDDDEIFECSPYAWRLEATMATIDPVQKALACERMGE